MSHKWAGVADFPESSSAKGGGWFQGEVLGVTIASVALGAARPEVGPYRVIRDRARESLWATGACGSDPG